MKSTNSGFQIYVLVSLMRSQNKNYFYWIKMRIATLKNTNQKKFLKADL